MLLTKSLSYFSHFGKSRAHELGDFLIHAVSCCACLQRDQAASFPAGCGMKVRAWFQGSGYRARFQYLYGLFSGRSPERKRDATLRSRYPDAKLRSLTREGKYFVSSLSQAASPSFSRAYFKGQACAYEFRRQAYGVEGTGKFDCSWQMQVFCRHTGLKLFSDICAAEPDQA